MTAIEAKKLADNYLTEEEKDIIEKVKQAASKGHLKIEHQIINLLTRQRLEALGYTVMYTGDNATISW